jgi:hypothetical protein
MLRLMDFEYVLLLACCILPVSKKEHTEEEIGVFRSLKSLLALSCALRPYVSSVEFDSKGELLASTSSNGCITVHEYDQARTSLQCKHLNVHSSKP